MEEDEMLTYEIPVIEARLMIMYLSEFPYKDVAHLVSRLHDQLPENRD